MTKKEKEQLNRMVEMLRIQDRALRRIFEERKKISRQAEEMGRHDELWEMLYADGESHYTV